MYVYGDVIGTLQLILSSSLIMCLWMGMEVYLYDLSANTFIYNNIKYGNQKNTVNMKVSLKLFDFV